MKNIQLNGVYFYSGFSKPEKVAKDVSDLVSLLQSEKMVISDNYLGDGNSDILDLIEDEADDLELLHDDLISYGLWLDPLVSELQEINADSYGLDADCYLEGILL